MLEVLLFLLGVHVTMQLIASLYRIVDLWYCLSGAVAGIALRLLLYGGLVAGPAVYLTGSQQTAWISGCIFFMLFHGAIFWVGKFVLWRLG